MHFKKSIALFVASALLTVTACSTSSTGRSKITFMSPAQMNKMGITSFEDIKTKEKISKNAKLNQYVQCVSSAITAEVPKGVHKGDWEVVVFDSEQINAFALPGGKIGVYTEILKVAKTQDQLAAIIGHEVAHVIEEHSNERVSSGQLSQAGLAIAGAVMESQNVQHRNELMAGLGLGVQYGVILPYGRAHEKEADIVGQNLMAQAGFDPAASIDLWKNMAAVSGQQPPEFTSTHPSHSTRINKLSENLTAANPVYMSQVKRPKCVKPAKF